MSYKRTATSSQRRSPAWSRIFCTSEGWFLLSLHFIILVFYHKNRFYCYLLSRFGPYFVEPIIVGLDPKTSEPFISSMDLIGNESFITDFAAIGTSGEQLFGLCETFWQPNLVKKLTL